MLRLPEGVAIDPSDIDIERTDDETMIINMGPQHPSTHGVLRLMLELDGETVLRTKPVIGYLHTGMEKTGEELTYVQGSTNVTRMDYLSPLHNELVLSLAVEALLGVEMPPRSDWIRMLMVELNRVSSHLMWMATNGMDLGSTSMMIYGFREREMVLAFFEKTTGLRMNHNFIRPGGTAADLPDGWEDDVTVICDTVLARTNEYDELLTGQPIFRQRTEGVGAHLRRGGPGPRLTGPMLRSTGVPWDLRRSMPYLRYDEVEFDVIVGTFGDNFDRYSIRLNEIRESIRIIRQIVEKMPAGDYRVQDKKVTPPPRARIDESMEALIHHFKVFTEGFKVPEGEVYVAVESPRGELGCYLVSDGSPKPYRMHIRGPELRQPPGPAADDARRPAGRRGGRLLDHRPGDGGGGPVSEPDPLRWRPPPADRPPCRGRPTCRRDLERPADHRPLPRAPLGADPALPPGPGAGRLAHPRGHGGHRRPGRCHARPRCSAPPPSTTCCTPSRWAPTWWRCAPTSPACSTGAAELLEHAEARSGSAPVAPPPTGPSPSRRPSAWPTATGPRACRSTTASSAPRRPRPSTALVDELRSGARADDIPAHGTLDPGAPDRRPAGRSGPGGRRAGGHGRGPGRSGPPSRSAEADRPGGGSDGRHRRPEDRHRPARPRRLLHPRALPGHRRLRRAAQGPHHDPRGGGPRGGHGQPARPGRRRFPGRPQVGDAAQGPGHLPGGQRGRERAGHLQGPPADRAGPPPAHRGRAHRRLRPPGDPGVHLHPRRVRPRPRAGAGRPQRGLRATARWAATSSARGSRSTSWSIRAPAPTSAARRRRCSSRSRASAASPHQAAVLPGRHRPVRRADRGQQRRDHVQPALDRAQRRRRLRRPGRGPLDRHPAVRPGRARQQPRRASSSRWSRPPSTT